MKNLFALLFAALLALPLFAATAAKELGPFPPGVDTSNNRNRIAAGWKGTYGGVGNECELAPGEEPKASCLRAGDAFQKRNGFGPQTIVTGYASTAQQSVIGVGNCPALTITKRHAVTVAHCMENLVSNVGGSWTNNEASLSNQTIRFMTAGTGSLTTMTRDISIKRRGVGSGTYTCSKAADDIAIIEFSSDLTAYTRARVYESGYAGKSPMPKLDGITWHGPNWNYKNRVNEAFVLTSTEVDNGTCFISGSQTNPNPTYHNNWPSSPDVCPVNGDSGGTFSSPESTYRLSYALMAWGGDLDQDGDCDTYYVQSLPDGGGPLLRRLDDWWDGAADDLGASISSTQSSFSSSQVSGTVYYKLWDVD